jgi:outer membrane protein insertion porin family
VGPWDEGLSTAEEKYYTGGMTQMLGIVELEYPIIKEAGLKFVTFLEVGNAFSRFPGWQELRLRSDWGLGLRWFSPIGPLRFEWGFALDRKPGEEESNFIFMIGPPF